MIKGRHLGHTYKGSSIWL